MRRLNSRVCIGKVGHRRYRPCRHALSYRVYSLFIDLDELDDLDLASRLLSVNRPGILSWWERDHGFGMASGLKRTIEDLVVRRGSPRPHTMAMLCFPRVLGYAFNPLTTYFCRDQQGRLQTMVYEVNNTFKGRHFYIVPAGEADNGTHFHSAAKAFFVSPFNKIEGDYTFRVCERSDLITVGVSLKVDGKPVLSAHQTARPEQVCDRALLAALCMMPLMTVKVIAGIHFEALRLWIKGLRPVRRPARSPKPAKQIQTQAGTME